MNKLKKRAIEIIAEICSLDIRDIKRAYRKPDYRVFVVPKRNGTDRTIHAPEGVTKLVQDQLYQNLLAKFSYHRVISPNVLGGIKKTSVMNHVAVHSKVVPKFMVAFDLKNAFHQVNDSLLGEALYDIFMQEIMLVRYRRFVSKDQKPFGLNENLFNQKWSRDFSFKKEERLRSKKLMSTDSDFSEMRSYLGKRYGNYTTALFPKKIVKGFRDSMLIEDKLDDVRDIVLEISKIISRIVTYKGIMVQGCPTSQILMALMVTHTDLLVKMSKYFETERVSIYVDDLAISTDFQDGDFVKKQSQFFIEDIESSTFWKFNSKKTRIYDISKEHPMITGLRLKPDPKGGMKATTPKKLQKQIRSWLHTAKMSQDIDVEMVAEGYIAYVMSVYRKVENIPSVIKTQLHKYFEASDISFLEHTSSKKRPKALSMAEFTQLVLKHRPTLDELKDLFESGKMGKSFFT